MADIENFADRAGLEDVITEVSTINWRSRIKDSMGGICIGVLMFFGAFPLLYWNEGRAVERYDTLQEGKSSTIGITVDSVDPANEGKLVHFTAEVTSAGTNLTDSLFGITTNDLRFRRDVQMYQWTEDVKTNTQEKVGGKQETTKEYSYRRIWTDRPIDSSFFKRPAGHRNPTLFPYNDLVLQQDSILVGAFELPPELVASINWYSPLRDMNVSNIPDDELRNIASILSTQDGFYFGNKTESLPDVGDTRVSFDTVKPGTISVIAQQNGNSFASYEADAGGSILIFRQGNYTSEALYAQEEAANQATTWILRFVGFLVMGFGIYLVFRPLEVIADVIPLLGTIVGWGIIFVAFFFAGIFSSITIAIAWLIHHPTIGLAVLFGTIAFVCGVAFLFKHFQKKNAPTPSSPNKPDPAVQEEAPDDPIKGGEEEIDVEAERVMPEPSAPPSDFANALDN